MELGGEASARLLSKLRMPVSADTVLRDIRRQEPATWLPLRVLGVDDWALRKGRTYGTILVDLERHAVVDVLPDRTSASLSTWLQEHPGVEVITRDRSTEYAKGAREGAPDAMQIADRWHLLQSTRQMLERYLPGVHARLQRLPRPASDAPGWGRTRAFPRTKAEELIGSESREQRLGVYGVVKKLRSQGWGIATIARELRINRKTARTYALAAEFPERSRQTARASLLDPYLPYLHQRWIEGCENASELWREVQDRGYLGTKRQVLRWLSARRRTPSKHDPHKVSRVPSASGPIAAVQENVLPGAKRLAWLLCRSSHELDAEERAVVATMHEAITAFISMVRTKTSTNFDAWLTECRESGVRMLITFARGIEADYQAVKAALDLPWSNAQCEGQVTRLKFLKRQMYGRAKFDLLRQRVLLAA